jgi:hypothetical protein
MNQDARRPSNDIARGLAYVCEHRKHVESTITGRPAAQRAALTRLTDPTRSADMAADLETVHKALRSAGDAKGIFGQDSVRSLIHPTGIDRDRPEVVLHCPRLDHPCTRFAQPVPGRADRCELTGSPLVRSELQS